MGVAAATVVLQYLRQLASPGAKNVNGERKKILERMVIAAAEDAGLANSLAIGVFHFLGATSPAIGFGARDAYAVAKGYGALASARRPESGTSRNCRMSRMRAPFTTIIRNVGRCRSACG